MRIRNPYFKAAAPRAALAAQLDDVLRSDPREFLDLDQIRARTETGAKDATDRELQDAAAALKLDVEP